MIYVYNRNPRQVLTIVAKVLLLQLQDHLYQVRLTFQVVAADTVQGLNMSVTMFYRYSKLFKSALMLIKSLIT